MKKSLVLLILTLMFLSGCSANDTTGMDNEKKTDEKIKVSTSTYPMYYIANEIGRDNINLDILVPIGVDPHEYELSLKEIKNLEDTDLFLYNGSGLENWGEKAANNLSDKNKAVIDASSEVVLLDAEDEHVEDEHEDHGQKDPHIWLDPTNMDKVAKKFTDELKKLDKDNSSLYDKNYSELSKKLNDLDKLYSDELKARKKSTILVSHKAFSYLAHRYNLEQISVTGISPHAEPSPKSISKLIDITRDKNIEYIFFEVLSSPKSVEMIADEANLKILTLNPIGGITKEQFESGVDYIDIMEENLENLKKALVE